MNALQDGVRSDDIKITKSGFETLLSKLEHSLEFEDISIYLENTYAESEYNRGMTMVIKKLVMNMNLTKKR